MKKISLAMGLMGACLWACGAYAVSAGTVGAADKTRGISAQTTAATATSPYVPTTGGVRGQQGLVNAYKTNQRNTYYMITQPDIDTACRERIFNCLSDYCGGITIVPGQQAGRCAYATESELYNYAMLCLQKDTSILLPQYGANTLGHSGGMNTAARLCPSYVQQEVMSYLSMANMADQLSKSHSTLCLQRRQELEAAMACHAVAMAYGNETTSMLTSQLTDACGGGVPGGSAEMVTRFANAGNMGANIWGWAEKIVSLEANKKGADWQSAVDAILASYTNRMNLACGDNLQLNTTSHTTGNNNQPSTLQTAAALITGVAFPSTDQAKVPNPYESQSLYMEVKSQRNLFQYDDAKQLLNAAMTNPSTTPNAFLTSAQMDDMQTAYKRGTKVFIITDGTRCYIIPVAELSNAEQSVVSQVYAGCVSR